LALKRRTMIAKSNRWTVANKAEKRAGFWASDESDRESHHRSSGKKNRYKTTRTVAAPWLSSALLPCHQREPLTSKAAGARMIVTKSSLPVQTSASTLVNSIKKRDISKYRLSAGFETAGPECNCCGVFAVTGCINISSLALIFQALGASNQSVIQVTGAIARAGISY